MKTRFGIQPVLRKLAILVALVGVVVLSTETAHAQSTGMLRGVVFDQTGNPLKGIRIGLASPTQIGGERIAYSDDQGQFRFLQLAPGAFTLSARTPGMKAYTQSGIRISQNQSFDIDVILEVDTGAVEEFVVVQKAPVIDTSRATVGETFDKDFLDSVPLTSRDYQGVATLTAGVVDSTGTGNPSIMGGSYFNNSYNVDGFDTTDPVTHTFGTNFSYDAIASEQVETAAFGVENSNTTGGVINVVTKSGSNRLEVDSRVQYSDENLRLFIDNRDRNTQRSARLSLNIGGPVIKDRVWFFVSGSLENNTLAIPSDPTGQLPNHTPFSVLAFDGFIKLTWQLNPRNKLEVKSFISVADFQNTIQSPLVENEAEERQFQRTTFNSLQWHGILTDNLLMNVGSGFLEERIEAGPMSCLFDEDCLNVPAEFDVLTGISRRNANRQSVENRRRLQTFAVLTWIKDSKITGNHQIKLGGRFDYVSNPLAETYSGDQLLFKFGSEPFAQREYCVNDPRERDGTCIAGWLRSDVSATNQLYYLVDQWRPTRYVTISPQIGLHRGISNDNQGRIVTDFLTLTPQIQVAWDATHDGRTKLSAAYGQLVDTGFLALARFSGRRIFSQTCFWDESVQGYVGNCRVSGGDDATTIGLPCGPTGIRADGTSCSTKLNPPRTHEFVLNGEREVATGWVLGLTGIYRRMDHQWDDLETNAIWNQGGTAIRTDGGWRNGRSQFIYDLETPDSSRRRLLSMSTILRKREGRLKLNGSYTWRRFEGTSNNSFTSGYLDTPGQEAYFYGPLTEDIRHNLKIQGSYQVTSWFSAGTIYEFVTGGPYNHYFFNNEYQSFSNFRSRRGQDWNGTVNPDDDRSLRMPDITLFNLQAMFDLKPLIGHRVQISADILNVLALRTTTAVVQSDGQFFEYPISRLPPFAARIGLRYQY